ADPLGADPDGPGRVLARVGVRANAEPAPLVGMRHDPVYRADQLVGAGVELALEILHHGRGDDRDLTEVDRSRGPVDREHVALADDQPAVLAVGTELASRDVD